MSDEIGGSNAWLTYGLEVCERLRDRIVVLQDMLHTQAQLLLAARADSAAWQEEATKLPLVECRPNGALGFTLAVNGLELCGLYDTEDEANEARADLRGALRRAPPAQRRAGAHGSPKGKRGGDGG